jgi:hypothetical protein
MGRSGRGEKEEKVGVGGKPSLASAGLNVETLGTADIAGVRVDGWSGSVNGFDVWVTRGLEAVDLTDFSV